MINCIFISICIVGILGCSGLNSQNTLGEMQVAGQNNIMVKQYNLLHRFDVQEGSSLFGSSIVVGGDNIFIGDPGSGKIFSYSNNSGDLWEESEVISAPSDVKGFGHDLALDGNTLIIGSYSRIQKEEGGVYEYRREAGIREVARSDDAYILGFSVAAHSGRVAYSRRERNDPAHQSGSVVVLRGNDLETFYSRAYPDYFGSSISLYGHNLFVLAPAVGDNGGAFSFDLRQGAESIVQFSVPSSLGRANAANEVLISGGVCMISGAGSANQLKSVVWRNCDPTDAEIVNASGHISASNSIVAFSDIQAIPRFGITGPFSVDVYQSENFEERVAKIMSTELESSLTRNVAVSESYLVVAFVNAAGEAFLEIYENEV